MALPFLLLFIRKTTVLNLIALLIALGGFIWGVFTVVKGLAKVDFLFVRFRDGVLVLSKETRFASVEQEFTPGKPWKKMNALQLAECIGNIDWFQFPTGAPIKKNSAIHKAIQECLRGAENVGILEAEAATDRTKG